MPRNPESNRIRVKEFYDENNFDINRNKAIKRLVEGRHVTSETIDKYCIDISDIPINRINSVNQSMIDLLTTQKTINDRRKLFASLPLMSTFPDGMAKLKVLSGPTAGHKYNQATINEYTKRLKSLKDHLGSHNDIEFYHTLTNAELVFNCINTYAPKSFVPIVSAILQLFRITPFDQVFNDYIIKYKLELKIHNAKIKMAHAKLVNITPLSIKWSDAFELYEQFESSDLYGLAHVLMGTLVLIPTLRNDWSNVRICMEPPVIESGCEFNYYSVSDKKLYLYDTKGSSYKGLVVIDINNDLHDLIMKSLEHNPRDFVFTQNNNQTKDKIYTDDSFSKLITQITGGHSIMDFRKSLTTYVLDTDEFPWPKKFEIINNMQHTLDTAIKDYYYPNI